MTNPSFEQGTAGWTCNNSTLSSESAIVGKGQKSARISGRAASWAGPTQTITQAVANGKTYSISGLVRTTRPQGSTARFTFYLNRSPGGALYIAGPQANVSNGQFTPISGNVTLQWSGTLLEARVYVETTGDSADFYLDDTALSEVPRGTEGLTEASSPAPRSAPGRRRGAASGGGFQCPAQPPQDRGAPGPRFLMKPWALAPERGRHPTDG